jgi:hypothetical protein
VPFAGRVRFQIGGCEVVVNDTLFGFPRQLVGFEIGRRPGVVHPGAHLLKDIRLLIQRFAVEPGEFRIAVQHPLQPLQLCLFVPGQIGKNPANPLVFGAGCQLPVEFEAAFFG